MVKCIHYEEQPAEILYDLKIMLEKYGQYMGVVKMDRKENTPLIRYQSIRQINDLKKAWKDQVEKSRTDIEPIELSNGNKEDASTG